MGRSRLSLRHLNLRTEAILVHRLLNPFGFAAGQLAVYQGASEAPSKAGPARTALPAAHFERNEAQGI
jgi:hypothetical protein